MATEEEHYAAAVVDRALSQVGYQPGRTNSKYGQWYGSPNALWCACGATWCFYQALGDVAALAVIGAQPWAPNGVGYAWTVKWREHLQATGTKVAPENARAGDVLFFKYATTDDRNTNPVNHVDLVTGSARATYVPTVGFNTPEPGTVGDPSNGRGVWKHRRALTDTHIVDCYRPPWWAHPDLVIYTQGALGELGYDPGPIDGVYGDRTAAAVIAFQGDHPPLTIDAIPGPETRAALTITITQQEEINMADAAEIIELVNKLRRERTNAHVKEMAYMQGIMAGLEEVAIRAGMAPQEVQDLVDARIEAATITLTAAEGEGS